MTDAAGLESAARTERTTRFPAFDGIRAVAALAVLTTHVAQANGTNVHSRFGAFTARLDVGVAVFFLISGFLLYRPFVAARLAGASAPRAAAYFWRRGLRILPAYWVALTIAVFVLSVPEHVPPAKDLVVYYGLVHLYSLDHVLGPIISSYTLVTEIAFYIFLPVYAFAIAARPATAERSVRRDAIGLAILFVVGVAYRVALGLAEPSGQRDFQLSNLLPGWIDVFAIGMALALISAWCAHRRARAPANLDSRWAPAVSWGLCALAFVLVSVLIGRPPPGETVEFSLGDKLAIHYLYLAVAVLLVLPAIFGPQDRGLVRGFLRNRIVQWLGLISYGLYLWNEPLIDKYLDWTDDTVSNTAFVKMMAAVTAMAVVAAAISYYVVERPVLKLKDRVPDTTRADQGHG